MMKDVLETRDYSTKKTERINYYSYLRVFACLSIVVIHCGSGVLQMFGGNMKNLDKYLVMSLVRFNMWAVPCFVMITGALLLDKEKLSISTVIRKYILRVLIALLLCGLLFSAFDNIMAIIYKEPGYEKGFRVLQVIKKGTMDALQGTGWAHLWYIYMLVGLYLMMPFYRYVAQRASELELIYLIIIFVIFISVLPALGQFNIIQSFKIPVVDIYPAFIFLGYMISKRIIKMNTVTSSLALIAGMAYIFFMNYFTVYKGNAITANLVGYSSLGVILLAVGMFGLFQNVFDKEKELGYQQGNLVEGNVTKGKHIIKRFILSIDSCTFEIYLFHMVFLRYFMRYKSFNPYKYGGVMGVLGFCIGIFLLTYVIVNCIIAVLKRRIINGQNTEKY